jgi:hypothetical protein
MFPAQRDRPFRDRAGEREYPEVMKESAADFLIGRSARSHHQFHPRNDADAAFAIAHHLPGSGREAIQEIQQNVAVDDRFQDRAKALPTRRPLPSKPGHLTADTSARFGSAEILLQAIPNPIAQPLGERPTDRLRAGDFLLAANEREFLQLLVR